MCSSAENSNQVLPDFENFLSPNATNYSGDNPSNTLSTQQRTSLPVQQRSTGPQSGTSISLGIEPSTPVHNQQDSPNPPNRKLKGPVPLLLSLEDGDEEVMVPDPGELPKDIGLSPGPRYMLEILRNGIEREQVNNSVVPVSEHMGQQISSRTNENDTPLNVEMSEPYGVLQNNLSESRQVGRYEVPSGFDPTEVKRLLTRVHRAVELGATDKKRTYRFHKRIAKPQKSPPLKRKRRLQRALRGENPFLSWRTEIRCCKRYNCFEKLCPTYLFEEYKRINAMNKLQAKRFLISLYNPTDQSWYVRDRLVCSRFLHKAFGFSTDLQCQVKGTPGARAAPTAQSLPRQVKKKTKRWCISNFILRLAERFAEAMPHKEEFALPVFTKTMLWEEFVKYWDETKPMEGESVPSKCYFFRIWKLYAVMVKTQKKHGFTVCSRCEMIREEMVKHLQDEETLNVLIEQYAQHLRFVQRERDAYEKRQNLAEENPGKYCSIIIDGADQKNFGIPHFPKQTKSDKGHKLKVKIVGCLEHVLRGGEKLSLYAMTEEYETGANHVIEVIHRVLQEKKRVFGKLPPNLFVQVDNCARENKNRYFFAYFQALIHLGVFKTIQISFLPIGHTHADIDQTFSSISAHLSINNAFTFHDMLCELAKCYAGRAESFHLDGIINFSGLCETSGCLMNASDLAEYRFFRFVCKSSRDNQGEMLSSTCDVKVQECDDWIPFPSSRAEGFLKFVPNFRNAPPMKTKELMNYSQVSKCLDSAEERVKDDLKMQELRAVRDKIFEVREESLHWDVDNVFEMHGDYIFETGDASNVTTSHVEDQMRQSCGYEPDDFIAVETKEDENTRFWIGRVKSVSTLDAQGRAKELIIRWYVPRGSDPWNAKYVPAWNISNGEKTVYEDTVDTACVILRFNSFTTAGRLRVSDKKAIKQMLDAN